jgi:hypothetical protein
MAASSFRRGDAATRQCACVQLVAFPLSDAAAASRSLKATAVNSESESGKCNAATKH